MKKFLACLLVVALVICMLPMNTMVYAATSGDLDSAAEEVALYVKPDAEAGGDGSEAKPFATLQEAADQIAVILAEDANTIINVNLMDGKHVLQETLTFGKAHSSSAKVVFQNAEGANPIITSGREIDSSKFAPVDGTDYYAYQFAEEDMIDGAYPDFRELQVNGKSAIMAKSEVYTFTADVGTGGVFKLPAEALAGITNENLEGAQLMVTSEWQVYGLHFGSITDGTDNAMLSINTDDWKAYTERVRTKRSFVGRTFYIQNHIALLDEPGEFYYDQSAGKIYYYPYADETLSECTVEYAMLDRLIYMENASNFVFDGLTFTGTSHTSFNHEAMLFGNGAYPTYYYDEGDEIIAGAICGTYTSDLTVQNCTFTELDTGAVMFEYGVKNFNIIGNTFRELGMYAIALGAKQLVWNSGNKQGGVENVTISNNYVDHIGLEVLCSTGIRVAKAVNTKVLHNTVKNVPYTGIGMGMGFTLEQPNDNFINLYNVEIAYNHVENFMYNGNDGGAIYICGANATVDYKTTDRISIHDNYIKANGYDKTAIGIYHDGSASNVHTYNNVIVDVASSTHGVIFNQEHVANQLCHNILIENNYSTIQGPTCSLGEEYNIVFKNNRVFKDSSALPAEAQAVIENAGIELGSEYVVRPVQLELSKLDSSVHYAIAPSNTAEEYGSAGNPVLITTAAQLQAIAGTNTEGKYYVLGNDIDLSGIANWTPIGDQSQYFKGNFDGKGYTISGLKMTTAEMYAGLFGRVFSPAVIKNVNVTGVNITLTGATGSSGLYASALVARNQGGNIYNCYTSGTITVMEGKAEAVRIGGIAGHSEAVSTANASTDADIINCISDVDISFTYNVDLGTQEVHIGGVAGISQIAGSYVARIANSANRGDIAVSAAEGITWSSLNYLYVGGVIGRLEGGTDSGTQPVLNNCYNAGAITGVTHNKNAHAGAVYGRLRNTNAQNLYTVEVGTGLGGYDIAGKATVTVMADADMQTVSFASSLSTGAETLNSGLLASSAVQAMCWASVEGSYPAHLNLKTVATFKLTNNDTVARTLSLNIEGLPEDITYKVSGDGVLLQPGASATVEVTFTADPETFAHSEEKVILKLTVVDEYGRTMNYPRAISIVTLDQPGTAENPYLIYTAEDLQAIPTNGLDKHYKLMADIDLSGIANWAPIAATGRFTGTFDGNGYTISNMKVTSVNGQCLGGLFGWIEYPAVIKNLTLENASVSIDHDFAYTSFGGLLVAYNMGGTIDNCKVTGSMSVTNAQAKEVSLGGVVGISKTNGADKTATIVNCVSDVDITLTCPAGGETRIGGIVAQVEAGSNVAYVANCASLGDITVNSVLTANTYVAGIVGRMETANNDSGTKSQLHNCYSAGSITGLTHAAYAVNTGAIYGRLRNTSVSNVYALSDTVAAHPGVDIQNTASVTGKIAAEMQSFGFVVSLSAGAGTLNSDLLTGSTVQAMYWAPAKGGYPVHAAEEYGTAENPYLIYTADDLKAIKDGLDEHYKLMADIDLTDIANWTPIGDKDQHFMGTFDGNGYTISGMKVTSVNGQCLGGLFGWIEYPAVIKNLTLENASVSVNHDFAYASFGGLLVANNQGGTIDNCKVTGSISVTNAQAKEVSLGGVVGISTTTAADKTATIVNCISDVDITLTCPAGGATYIGGIVAKADASAKATYTAVIANCASLGDITVNSALTSNTYVAGIVGWMESNNNASATKSELHNCYSAGSINGLTHAAYNVNTGAIYGRLRYTNVSNVYALSDFAAAHPGVDIQNTASVTGKIAAEMRSVVFASSLSAGAEALNNDLLKSSTLKAKYWATTEAGYPIHSDEETYDPVQEPDGTEEKPYFIYTVDDLKAIKDGLGEHYKLMADIDLTDIANWTPIGDKDQHFMGTFDGNGYTISNMKVTSVNGQCLGGLFGWIEYPAVIKNLTLENASVSVDHDFGYTSFGGLLVANNQGGTIDNCNVTGVLSVTNAQAKEVSLGGIVGISKTNGADKTATIVNCISDVDITLTCPAGAATYIGGIVAQANAADNATYKAIVANCGYLGDITVNSKLTTNTYVAGIVGWMESNNNASATKSELHNCYSAGSISGLTHAAYNVNTGAIYGRLRYTTVSNVYALSDVAAAHPGVDIQNIASVKGKTAAEMRSAGFASSLSAGTETLNNGLLVKSTSKAKYWAPTENGYPIHSKDAVASVGGKVYASVRDAVNAAVTSDETMELIRSTNEIIIVETGETLKLNLNGNTVGQIVLNGELVGIDETTKDYNVTPDAVKVIVANGEIDFVHSVDNDSKNYTDAGYAAHVDEDGYATFNYFELKISNVTLRPENARIGYKLDLAGNANVKAMLDPEDAFGVYVYIVGKDGGGEAHATAEDFDVGLQTKMVMIKNILTAVTGDSVEDAKILERNATNMDVKIGINAYLNINGEKVEVSYADGKSLREVLSAVENKLTVSGLSKPQEQNLVTMYKTYALDNSVYKLDIPGIESLVTEEAN